MTKTATSTADVRIVVRVWSFSGGSLNQDGDRIREDASRLLDFNYRESPGAKQADTILYAAFGIWICEEAGGPLAHCTTQLKGGTLNARGSCPERLRLTAPKTPKRVWLMQCQTEVHNLEGPRLMAPGRLMITPLSPTSPGCAADRHRSLAGLRCDTRVAAAVRSTGSAISGRSPAVSQ